MSHRFLAAAAVTACALSALPARARADDPKFDFAKPEDKAAAAAAAAAKPAVEWKVSAQAGLVMTTGNSRTTTFSSGLAASRKEGGNRLALDAGGAYARSGIQLAIDDNGDGVLAPGEIRRIDQTTTKMWATKLRYDRFLTEHNSLYITALAGGDEPAGKEFVGGGQAGYSRSLFKNDMHNVVAEVGYDFTYEDFVGDGDPVSIHSGRGFLGYEAKLSEDTGFAASGEILINVNELDTPAGPVDRGEDIRFNGKTAVTTKIYGAVSLRFSFTARFDDAPARRPPFEGLPYAAGFAPLADELDTLTELSLIVNVL